MGRARRITGAFTLLEILVAVGVVALVAAGLAAIFDAVGKTVSGGRRVSVLNAYASLIEDQMRRDVASMTRDGYLVVRQQYVDRDNNGRIDPGNWGPDGVPLYRGQAPAGWRPRRIDELMFFAKGEFTSARRPVSPELIARANTARVYYGHGQRWDPSQAGYDAPPVGWDTQIGLTPAAPRRLGIDDPNQYASEWILLRHLTLLRQPGTATGTGPLTPIPGLNMTSPAGQYTLRDKQMQVAGQPAALSIFRALTFDTSDPPARITPGEYLRKAFTLPRFDTGVVDIATTDLEEVRAVVTSGAPGPLPYEWWDQLGNQRVLAAPQMTPGPASRRPDRPPPGQGVDAVDVSHAWMHEGMPAESLQIASPHEFRMDQASSAAPSLNPTGVRVRCEDEPVRLLDALDPSTPFNVPGLTPELARQLRYADLMMLSASNFVPRCSEFIVEWSFGRTDANGNVIWHGPRRPDDAGVAPYPPVPASGVAQVDARATAFGLANPNFGLLVEDPNDRDARPLEEYVEFDFRQDLDPRPPNTGVSPPAMNRSLGAVERRRHPVTDRLIYGYRARAYAGLAAPREDEAILTSHFGYVDATFNPDRPIPGDAAIGLTPPDSILQGVAEGARPAAWTWPRLLRVTMTLADKSDPPVEKNYVFVFTLPEAR